MPSRNSIAISCLLVGAVTWGVIWYPFRLLEQAGLSSSLSTLAAYVVAVIAGALVAPRALREITGQWRDMLQIALFAGLSNVGFLVAATGTEVVRVVLLFYLAPVWTVPLAWMVLKERLSARGYAVIAMAMAGALIMLWRPELGAPLPRNGFEWLALAAGVFFAATNVLVRRAQAASAEAKALAACIGVLLVAAPAALVVQPDVGAWAALVVSNGVLIAIIGGVLLAMTIAMQYGLSLVPANRAAVILLTELIVAAMAAYVLAGEKLRLTDALGGALIVAGGWVSALGERSDSAEDG
ncbi:MAG: DMT family transporter [Betaproteobacteria bacterium]|nr:DMT family transporter [Betaproteobacteria bacterium]